MRLLFTLLSLAVMTGAQEAMFHTPVSLGTTRWGVTETVNLNNEGMFAVVLPEHTMITTDGGKSFTAAPDATIALGTGLVSTFPQDNTVKYSLHDFGNSSAHNPVTGTSRIVSPFANFWEYTNDGKLVTSVKNKTVTFQGFPTPIHCDPSYGACPLRLQGTGSVRLHDGTFVRSGIVFYDGTPKAPKATSIVCFRSSDGFTWDYTGTIANATDYLESEEGPNEHDLVLLDSDLILSVVRLDGGDGLPDHPYKNYTYTVSTDAGVTWTPLQFMPDTGCARPRLAMLGENRSLLLMSGGRMRNIGTDDVFMWVDWSGMRGNPTPSPEWEKFSISYYHNKLAPSSMTKFPSNTNSSKVTVTSAYTALVQVDAARR
eukprot:m.49677 g.49677  ORF g.49677 m.49677 type:complete len:372 (-) comp10623_c0_seq3:173-1288(-)